MTKKLCFKRERRFLEYLKDIEDCLKEHHFPITFPDPSITDVNYRKTYKARPRRKFIDFIQKVFLF